MRQSVFFFAYLDPGTGSMLLQVLLGGIAAVAVGGRVMWQRMTGRAPKADSAKTDEETPTPSEQS
jgi:hypothetical protein